jgi:putative ABC transport system permease protein
MYIHPILSAMRRNKVGATVIAVQMAVTLAILCNALFIIEQRLALSERATGTDEADLFAIDMEWVGTPNDLSARARTDLEALRALPGVEDAYVTNSYPLTNSGWSQSINIHPDQVRDTTVGSTYFGDEHALHTMGLKLIAGRNFLATEISEHGLIDSPIPPGVIVTRSLAEKLFPGATALGQPIYVESPNRGEPIVGIVEALATPWTAAGRAAAVGGNSIIEPYRFVAKSSSYLVRAKPNQLSQVMRAAQSKLLEINRARVLKRLLPLTAWREKAYRDDRGLVVILGVVCVALVAVTAFGIVGLTSYWVSQRRQQIGIRRALGATRSAITRHFQTENLLIAAAGALLGIGLAIGLNLWMVSSFEMERLHLSYAVAGALTVLLLGQLAVLWPALRAASIPPALATRAV